MFNHFASTTKNVIGSLPICISLSILTMASLSIATSPAQATNSPVISCANTPPLSTIKKELSLLSKNEQQQLIDCMLTRLQPYQQKQRPARQQYLAYKAQAWLNYANYQYSINSKASTGRYALQTGSNILTALDNSADEQIALTTDISPTSALMRPDLWATLQALKESGGIMLAPRELAFSEVELIWAASEQCQHGRRQSGAHFRMSERWLEQAREAYINAHDSKSNVALEERINYYFKQYAPLDTGDDKCQIQALPASAQSLSKKMLSEEPLLKREPNARPKAKLSPKLNVQPTIEVITTEALQIEITRTLSTIQTTPSEIPVPVTPAPLISLPLTSVAPIPMSLSTVIDDIAQ